MSVYRLLLSSLSAFLLVLSTTAGSRAEVRIHLSCGSNSSEKTAKDVRFVYGKTAWRESLYDPYSTPHRTRFLTHDPKERQDYLGLSYKYNGESYDKIPIIDIHKFTVVSPGEIPRAFQIMLKNGTSIASIEVPDRRKLIPAGEGGIPVYSLKIGDRIYDYVNPLPRAESGLPLIGIAIKNDTLLGTGASYEFLPFLDSDGGGCNNGISSVEWE